MPRPSRPGLRTSISRKRKGSPAGDWYTIRRILDERQAKGRIEYLVDWEDNTETGKAYAPTWSLEVTEEARQEWELAKRSRGANNSESQNSQSPRPSNWRQLSRLQIAGAPRLSAATADEVDRPRKIAKISYSATPSEEPEPSIASPSSADSIGDEDDIDVAGPDCLIQRDFDAPPHQQLVIEFHKNPNFEPSEYHSAGDCNTQDSGLSSQSIAELESQDERIVLHSQPSRQTIPDSQEFSALTWSQDIEPAGLAPSPDKVLDVADAAVQPAAELCQDLSPESPGERPPLTCATDVSGERTHLKEAENEQDIPSHQFAHLESVSIESQRFNLTTPGTTKPNSEHQESFGPGRNDIAESTPSLEFQSQLQPPILFDIPDSSLSSAIQQSPVRIPLAESITANEQNEQNEQNSAADNLSESQDAQILHHADSHVEAFIDSLDIHSAVPLLEPPTASPQGSCHTHSKASQESVPATRMDQGDASRSPNLAPQPSAVEELSQILNLDNVLTEGTSAHSPESGLAGHDEHFGVPEIESNAQGQPQQQSPMPPPEHGHREIETPGHPEPSASESLQNIVNLNFPNPDVPTTGTMGDVANGPELPTVSLADISRQPEMGPLPLMPSLMAHDDHLSAPFGSSGMSVSMGQPELGRESSDDSSDDSQEQMTLKHIVTLPFQASLRPAYDDTLLESKRAVTQFGASFNSEEYVEPEEALVQQIDHLFSRLHNICDYPPDALGSVLEDLPSNQLIKYCCDANPKFNFIYELLHRLTKDNRVLIVARSVDLLRLLHRMTEVLEVECVCEDIGKLKSELTGSAARVTLILPQRDVSGDDYDVVIGFDHSFGSSKIGKTLEHQAAEAKSPLVLVLVTTHSIEHIDHYISEDRTLLERKNALLSGIVRSRQLVSDPERGYPEPHELASLFLDYLNGQVEGIVWDPVPVPEEVMDIYLSSQSRSQMATSGTPEPDNDRKRKHDEPDDEDAKRMRLLPHGQSTVQTNRAPLPDDVKAMLSSVNPGETSIKSTQVHVSVSLATLQALAEQHAEMRRQLEVEDRDPQYQSLISGLETRVKEYERTNAKMYASQRGALEDRNKFQQEARKAEAALQQVVETSQKDAEKLQKTVANLEGTVTRLTANPDGTGEETPLARTEKLLQDAQDKVNMLEKRLENAHKDADYARSLYQEATMASGALRGENADLKEQVSDLSKKTDETLGKVHKLQSENITKQYLRQIRDLKAQVREREIELDCTREELRQLKNGRRETRQVSVPRSPRMGLMSPRTGRATYGAGGGGSTSRGTSPAPTSGAEGTGVLPGAQFMGQQPGNGRWNHLRE